MLTAMLLMLAVQEPPTIVWAEPMAQTEAGAEIAAPLPELPAWALADPYGYERAECSPLVRKEPSMEGCQARVRAELAAHLGDRLPEGMQGPTLTDCSPQPGGAYDIACNAPRRERATTTLAAPRDCANRPERGPDGRVVWTDRCQPEPGERDGLTIPLFGSRDR
jgi:hypothetical protein